MSLAAAFVMIAQAAAPTAASSGSVATPAPSSVVAETVTARARVLRPARITFDKETAEVSVTARSAEAQRGRDGAGTIWIEFS